VSKLVSWGIVLFEYFSQAPANRIGFSVMSARQLKILQEVVTPSVFVPFTVYYLKRTIKVGLMIGRFVYVGSRLFHVSEQTPWQLTSLISG
jgi:uncharacterized protein (DUF486 family)